MSAAVLWNSRRSRKNQRHRDFGEIRSAPNVLCSLPQILASWVGYTFALRTSRILPRFSIDLASWHDSGRSSALAVRKGTRGYAVFIEETIVSGNPEQPHPTRSSSLSVNFTMTDVRYLPVTGV